MLFATAETTARLTGKIATNLHAGGWVKISTNAVTLPEGKLREDHTSLLASSGFSGGQFITGKLVLAQVTGPRPLLRPATAIKTIGMAIPSYCM